MKMLLAPCAGIAALLLFFVAATLLVWTATGWLLPLLFGAPLLWMGLVGIAITAVSLLLGCCPHGCDRNRHPAD